MEDSTSETNLPPPEKRGKVEMESDNVENEDITNEQPLRAEVNLEVVASSTQVNF